MNTIQSLDSMYQAAIESHGKTIADLAAASSIDAFECAALAGLDLEACEAEQAIAFKASLQGE